MKSLLLDTFAHLVGFEYEENVHVSIYPPLLMALLAVANSTVVFGRTRPSLIIILVLIAFTVLKSCKLSGSRKRCVTI